MESWGFMLSSTAFDYVKEWIVQADEQSRARKLQNKQTTRKVEPAM